MLSAGETFAGDFRIHGLLGEGGFGVVYEAEQLSTGRRRALKLMHPEHALDGEATARFVREARISAEIDSEHVVEVIAAGVAPGGVPWIAMELLEGSTVAELVARNGPLAPAALLELFEQLCHGLAAAHAVGVVHRDLKPENVFLARQRGPSGGTRVKILDFGIARWVDETESTARNSRMLGSPRWMASEQLVVGAQLGPQTDIWALGLIAFFALTGRSYWRAAQDRDGSKIHLLLVEIASSPIEPATSRATELGQPGSWPVELDEWFARCLRRNPQERFPTADAAYDALRRVLSGSPALVRLGAGSGTSAATGTPSPMVATRARAPERTVPLEAALVPPTRAIPASALASQRAGRRWGLTAALVVGGLAALSIIGVGVVLVARASRTRRNVASASAPSPDLVGSTPSAAPHDTCESGDPAACLAAARAMSASSPADDARVADLYRSACTLSSGEGCAKLGEMHADGRGVARDEARAAALYRQACSLGDGLGCTWLGGMQQEGRGGLSRAPADAVASYRRACDLGAPAGCNELGLVHELGIGGLVVDLGAAAALYRRACDGGNATACANLGLLVADGRGGLARDEVAALALHRRACDGGAANGCRNVGRMYRDARGGLIADAVRAAALFQRACDADDTDACGDLAQLHQTGQGGLTQDYARAAELFERACNGGQPTACNDLGVLYEGGHGAPAHDARDAMALFRRACDEGDPLGCTNLGGMYENGTGGLAVNEIAAASLHRRACDGQEPIGCRCLAAMYETGRGGLALDLRRAATLYRSACDASDQESCDSARRLQQRAGQSP